MMSQDYTKCQGAPNEGLFDQGAAYKITLTRM